LKADFRKRRGFFRGCQLVDDLTLTERKNTVVRDEIDMRVGAA
jgi:hypothetical protein